MRTLLFLFIFCVSCQNSSPQVPRENLQGSYVQRRHDENIFINIPPRPRPLTAWPWRRMTLGDFPRITKEFFRCKGEPSHLPRGKENPGRAPTIIRDCGGSAQHGLPVRDGKEYIYPCLIELLNYIQEQTMHRVMITCGHRCPPHNRYSDDSKANSASKHMLGAEVDFYVEGMQDRPQEIIKLLERYYKTRKETASNKEYEVFHTYEKGGLNVSTPPRYNKEIFIKLYLPHEGRDHDNSHPYPYIGIQVRYDRQLNTPVVFEGPQTEKYLRH